MESGTLSSGEVGISIQQEYSHECLQALDLEILCQNRLPRHQMIIPSLLLFTFIFLSTLSPRLLPPPTLKQPCTQLLVFLLH